MPEDVTKPKISKRLWAVIIGLVVITIGLVAYSAKALRDVAVLTEKETPVSNVPEIPIPKSPEFENDPEPEPDLPEQPSKPTSDEMPFANAVPGNPLVVILPGANRSLGQISIEKYDSDGNATGEPLPRGTQVQIPDPNNPGEKIRFRVP